ncbi:MULTISPECIES: low molecular weight phosphatase family protein [unclassified Lentilitoribacter]|uniref:arsenate-mycothiol transferase ArsC n=1 Tax=unclassified Lentilitoribacter TaxID=2647570 RepID=UPI0013A70479|nr:low molecular weight phosphatase family protein [Lentilitoribacter sp. Alg239-R112]
MSAPSSILFICGMNSIRSPMAEVIARSLLPKGVFVQSAGIREGERDQFVEAVLAEVGLDLGSRQPRLYNEMADGFYDVIVTLTPEAHHRALEITRTSAAEVIYWPTSDPTVLQGQGKREQILEAYRQVRDGITANIKEHFLK